MPARWPARRKRAWGLADSLRMGQYCWQRAAPTSLGEAKRNPPRLETGQSKVPGSWCESGFAWPCLAQLFLRMVTKVAMPKKTNPVRQAKRNPPRFGRGGLREIYMAGLASRKNGYGVLGGDGNPGAKRNPTERVT